MRKRSVKIRFCDSIALTGKHLINTDLKEKATLLESLTDDAFSIA